MSFFKFQLCDRFLRVKVWRINFYVARHTMAPIRFEKQARYKKRRRLRGMALDRADHKCEMCGCEIDWKSVSIHHIKPRLTHPELEFDPENLMALCHDCHVRIHEIERLQKIGICPSVATMPQLHGHEC